MKVYLTEGCCLFYSDSRAVTKWEPELFGFLPLARKVLCALPVQLSPPRMSLLLLSKPYASFNPISNISLFILPMGEFWNLPKVIKHIRGKLREPDSSHPVQYSFFHTSVVQRAQCPACLRNVIYLPLPLSRGVIIPINTKRQQQILYLATIQKPLCFFGGGGGGGGCGSCCFLMQHFPTLLNPFLCNIH